MKNNQFITKKSFKIFTLFLIWTALPFYSSTVNAQLVFTQWEEGTPSDYYINIDWSTSFTNPIPFCPCFAFDDQFRVKRDVCSEVGTTEHTEFFNHADNHSGTAIDDQAGMGA